MLRLFQFLGLSAVLAIFGLAIGGLHAGETLLQKFKATTVGQHARIEQMRTPIVRDSDPYGVIRLTFVNLNWRERTFDDIKSATYFRNLAASCKYVQAYVVTEPDNRYTVKYRSLAMGWKDFYGLEASRASWEEGLQLIYMGFEVRKQKFSN